jgi:DNA polymerase III delta subunit
MLIYLEGNEPFLAHQAINQLKQRYLSKNDGVELVSIDVTNPSTSLRASWADLQAVPLFAQTRLVIIKNLAELPMAEQESLSSYLNNLPQSTVAVVWAGAKSLTKNSPLLKALDKAPKIISVVLPTGSALKKHLQKRADYYGLKLEPALTSQLLEEFGSDLWALENELAVLALGGQTTARSGEKTEPFALYRAVQNNSWSTAKKLLCQEYANGAPIELLIGSIASALRKKAVSPERREATKVLIDIDAGIKTGWLDEAAAVALMQADLPKGRQNRVEWEQLWEESLGG